MELTLISSYSSTFSLAPATFSALGSPMPWSFITPLEANGDFGRGRPCTLVVADPVPPQRRQPTLGFPPLGSAKGTSLIRAYSASTTPNESSSRRPMRPFNELRRSLPRPTGPPIASPTDARSFRYVLLLVHVLLVSLLPAHVEPTWRTRRSRQTDAPTSLWKRPLLASLSTRLL